MRCLLRPSKLHSYILTEAYVRNDNINWLDIFKKIKEYLLTSNKNIENFFDKLGIVFEVIPGNEHLIGGYFDLCTRKIIIMFTQDILDEILHSNENNLFNLAANFRSNFIHEDTHSQQQNKSKVDTRKNYISPTLQFWNEDLGKDIDCFTQRIEADAYGREIGARLEKIYADESTYAIFAYINSNTVKDEYCKKIINVYKDPRIDDKANHAFFRALYDFLQREEE